MHVRETISDITDRIEAINTRLTSTTMRYGIDPVQGGGSGVETNILNGLSKKWLWKRNNEENIELVEIVENALKCLDESEKDILLTLYAADKKGAVYELMDKYHYEKTNIYTIANKALEKVSYRIFGDA